MTARSPIRHPSITARSRSSAAGTVHFRTMRNRVEIVAHRGASAHAPEHTFAAFDLALEMGADILELDVRPAADGRLVVLHDPTLERTTGDPRAVAQVPSSELHGPVAPPLLDDVLEHYADRIPLLVEAKDPSQRGAQALVRALAAHPRAEAVVQSFHVAALHRVRRLAPSLPLKRLFCESVSVRQILPALDGTSRYGCGIGVLRSTVDPVVVLAAHARGLQVHAYTVNDGAEMRRLAAIGVDGLITDAPDRARDALERVEAPAAA